MNIVITGASSGLGAALALAYAGQGARLGLIGRRVDQLEFVASQCRARGAEVVIGALSVLEKESLAAWLSQFDESAPIDLLIANAGISAGTGEVGESAAQVAAIFETNLQGVLNSINPLIERMTARRFGQIAIMSSLASFRGFGSAPAYCASKAAVRVYGEGLRGALSPFGVSVSVICPGFVKTPMTDVNTFPMPFLMEAGRAAEIIKRGLSKKNARIAFPTRLYLLVQLVTILPPSWVDFVVSRLPAKPTVAK